MAVLFILVKLDKMTENKGFKWFESHLGFFIFSLYKF
jgi:hypothetical protein